VLRPHKDRRPLFEHPQDLYTGVQCLGHDNLGVQMPDLSQLVYAVGRIEAGIVNLLGTAFAVSSTQVATAYHVVGPDDRNLVLIYPKVKSLLDYQDTTDASVRTSALTMAAADPIRDLCVLNVIGGQISGAPNLGSADRVPTGAPVVTLGFPHANVGRMVLTQQQAHVGARILMGNAAQTSKHIVLNTQAREGQSGGPVLDASMTTVVAVLLGSYAPGGGGGISLGGVDPATLHQTTHAISAEYIKDML
jgi:hypothetical protein